MGKGNSKSAASRVPALPTFMAGMGQYVQKSVKGFLPGRGGRKLALRKISAFHAAKPGLSLGRVEQSQALLEGQFNNMGQVLDIGPWTEASPSRQFADWLHGFDWLADLLAVDSEAHHAKAQDYVDGWIETYGKGNVFAWKPERLARRLFNWLSYWSPALATAENDGQLNRRRASVVNQLTALRASLKSLPHGLARLQAGCALAMGGARMTDSQSQFLERGLDFLDAEISLQILPDGGHISRSPSQTAEALRLLLTLDSLLADRGVEGSKDLSRAIDRLSPMVEFFRQSNGTLSPFQGGGEWDSSDIAELLSVAPGSPKAFGYGPHTGYQRLASGGTIIIVDTGGAAPRPFDSNSHLSPLAIDLSTKEGIIFTSCGFNPEQADMWQRPVRAAAAHSTLILDNRSPGRLLISDWKRRIVGDVVEYDCGPVRASRKEQESGIWLESHHEGYMSDYGLAHRRRLFLPKDGDDIRGEDALFVPIGTAPLRRDEVPFHIRFHLHPNVRVSLSQDQSSALLVVEGKAGWRFRTDGGALALEDSVYLGRGRAPIKTQQIVITGEAFCDSDGESRSNRVRWSLRRLKAAEPKV